MSGPADPGFVSSRVPTANRSTGSSVHGCTNTAPRTPWAGPIRPTATSSGSLIGDLRIMGAARRSRPVDVDHVDPNALPADAGDDLAEGPCCAPIAADDPTEIVRMYPNLQPGSTPVVHHVDRDIVRMVDDAAYEVL